MDFDVNNSAPEGSGLFALPFGIDDAEIVVVPVPWDATSSQDKTSSGAPQAVYEASMYVELFDARYGRLYRRGIAMDAAVEDIRDLNATAIEYQTFPDFDPGTLDDPCEALNAIVRKQVAEHLIAGKRVGLLGGDHSVSYGSIAAHLEKYPEMSILQIDAHCDLRCAFDGITWSHASIMYNVLERLGAPRLIQVGVRALCDFESEYVETSDRAHAFFDCDIHDRRSAGESWSEICSSIVNRLADTVYVSLDIDGLDPSNCPHTGTPVPGGLSYNDTLVLLRAVSASGRRIVGFDLVEVGAAPFDANIAAHLLYQLCGALD